MNSEGLKTTVFPWDKWAVFTCSEAGRELPRRHEQRVVPGGDQSADADGLPPRVLEQRPGRGERSAVNFVGTAGEVLEAADRVGEVQLRVAQRRGKRLARVYRLHLHQLVEISLQNGREFEKQVRALLARHVLPGRALGL